MTAPLRLSFVGSLARNQHDAGGVQMSQAKVFDPYRYRALFPDQWSAFLKANFRSAEEVAVVFDVTYQTARNWLEATHRPSGDKVAYAALTMPRRFAAAMQVAA